MLLISHRGNINGKLDNLENNPTYVDATLMMGYDVEIDIWYKDYNLYLGHDYPQYKIDISWLNFRQDYLWIHCKNISAIEYFNKSYFNYFWHEEDTITLTSKGYIWAYPGKQPIKGSISVMPELFNDDVSHCYGVCSDYIQNYE